VQTLVDLDWRRRRLVRYGEIKLQKRLTGIRDDNERARHWTNLIGLANSFEKLTSAEEVEERLSMLSPLYRNTIQSLWPLAKEEDPKAWGAKIAKGLSAQKTPTFYQEGDEFIAVIESESIELDLMRLERIDAQFEANFKRLVQTKTVKQALHRLLPKLITISNPNKPAEENKPDGGKS
jgi:hypothetical protein